MTPLAWDTETRSLRWWENPAFLGSVADGSRAHAAPIGPWLKEELEATRHLVGANAKFDAHMTREALGLDVLDPSKGYVVDDILMMSRLVYGARRYSHGLKQLATDYIDPSAGDSEGAMENRYRELTGRRDMAHDDAYYLTWQGYPEDVERYAALDARYTYDLYNHLMPQITEDPKLDSLYKLERQVQTVLYDAERKGIHVDQTAVERLSDHYGARGEAARSALQRTLGGVHEGPGSATALREALLRAGVQLTEVTERTGQYAVSRKALEPFADHPAVKALFEWRRVNKFQTTYLAPLEGRDVIHTNFRQSEAWTGRMSCSSPNMQNLPKRSETTDDENLKVRSVFVPRPGMEFLVADFEGIEMRILAHYLGDQDYAQLISSGDPHAITAAAAWGGDPSAYHKGTDQRWLRDIAKHVTYGITYGGGGPVVMSTINRMVTDVGRPEYRVDIEQARAIRKKITGSIPGFKALTDTPWRGKSYPQGRIYEQLLASQEGPFGYVRTLMGRKQWINLEKSYVALSGLIQGSAADIMKQAAVNAAAALKPYGAYPLLFVHDELVAECPRGQGAELLPVLIEAMESAASIHPRLSVEAHVTARSYAHHG